LRFTVVDFTVDERVIVCPLLFYVVCCWLFVPKINNTVFVVTKIALDFVVFFSDFWLQNLNLKLEILICLLSRLCLGIIIADDYF